jgi:hypothetical protein
LETGGFGAFGAGALAVLFSPTAGIVYGLVLIAVGFGMRLRAEKRQARADEIRVFDSEGAPLEGRARQEKIQQIAGLLARDAAGRPAYGEDEEE